MSLMAVLPAALSFIGGERANRANAKMAREQMAFQQYNSDTAHQREVEDLAAAGLNPILSARYGGASTPVGAFGQQVDTLSPAVNSGLSAYRAGLETKKQEAEIELLTAQAGKAREEASAVESSVNLNRQLAGKAMAESAYTDAMQNKVLREIRDLVPSQVELNKASAAERAEMAHKFFYEIQHILPLEARHLAEELKTKIIQGKVSESDYGLVMEGLKRLPGVEGLVSGAVGGFAAGRGYRSGLSAGRNSGGKK